MNSYWTTTLNTRLSRRRALAGAGGLGAGALALSLIGCDNDGDSSGGSKGSGLVSPPNDTTKQAVKGGIMISQLGAEPQNYDPIGGRYAHARYSPTAVCCATRLAPWRPPDGGVEATSCCRGRHPRRPAGNAEAAAEPEAGRLAPTNAAC
jgi:hypothetical protein